MNPLIIAVHAQTQDTCACLYTRRANKETDGPSYTEWKEDSFYSNIAAAAHKLHKKSYK